MLQTPSKTTQTLLSSRIPRDNEHERYHPCLLYTSDAADEL